MSKVALYHNPRCTKSRQTLELLRSEGIEPEIVEYLKTPPSESELRSILEKLKMKPRDLIRRKEAAFKESGLDDPSLSDEEVLQAMVENPILIERPIAIKGNQAAVGRPPENVLEIL